MLYDSTRFAHVRLLEDNWKVIRGELAGRAWDPFRPWYDPSLYDGKLDTFALVDGYMREKPRRYEKICALFPRTMKILDQIEGLRTAAFMRMEPGTYLPPHRGAELGVIRTLLGIQVPPGCALVTRGVTRHHHAGRCIVFDDRHVHEAWHMGEGDRVLMLIDQDDWVYESARPERRTAGEIVAGALQNVRYMAGRAQAVAERGPAALAKPPLPRLHEEP